MNIAGDINSTSSIRQHVEYFTLPITFPFTINKPLFTASMSVSSSVSATTTIVATITAQAPIPISGSSTSTSQVSGNVSAIMQLVGIIVANTGVTGSIQNNISVNSTITSNSSIVSTASMYVSLQSDEMMNLLPLDTFLGLGGIGSYWYGVITPDDNSNLYNGQPTCKVTTVANNGYPDGFITDSAGAVPASTTYIGNLMAWIPSGYSVFFSFRETGNEGQGSVVVAGNNDWQKVTIGPWTTDVAYSNFYLQGHETSDGPAFSFWIVNLQTSAISTLSANISNSIAIQSSVNTVSSVSSSISGSIALTGNIQSVSSFNLPNIILSSLITGSISSVSGASASVNMQIALTTITHPSYPNGILFNGNDVSGPYGYLTIPWSTAYELQQATIELIFDQTETANINPSGGSENYWRYLISANLWGTWFAILEQGNQGGPGYISWTLDVSGTDQRLFGAPTFSSLNQQVRISLIYDNINGILQVYYNGVLESSSTFTPGTLSWPSQIMISSPNGPSNGAGTLPGIVSDLRIWSGVRSATDITNSLWTHLNGTEPGLVGYWPLNNSNLVDLVSGNNATLYPAAIVIPASVGTVSNFMSMQSSIASTSILQNSTINNSISLTTSGVVSTTTITNNSIYNLIQSLIQSNSSITNNPYKFNFPLTFPLTFNLPILYESLSGLIISNSQLSGSFTYNIYGNITSNSGVSGTVANNIITNSSVTSISSVLGSVNNNISVNSTLTANLTISSVSITNDINLTSSVQITSSITSTIQSANSLQSTCSSSSNLVAQANLQCSLSGNVISNSSPFSVTVSNICSLATSGIIANITINNPTIQNSLLISSPIICNSLIQGSINNVISVTANAISSSTLLGTLIVTLALSSSVTATVTVSSPTVQNYQSLTANITVNLTINVLSVELIQTDIVIGSAVFNTDLYLTGVMNNNIYLGNAILTT